MNIPNKKQTRPGKTRDMDPKPKDTMVGYRPAGKLQDKVVIITGGDSGIGRATAIACAKEGAHIVVIYLNEHEDAKETQRLVEAENRKVLLIAGDVGDKSFSNSIVDVTLKNFGRIDVLINNAAEQHPQKDVLDITEDQLVRTFRTNIFSMFYLVQAALPHLKNGSSIINTTSVTAYKGHEQLLDYSSTKGAIVTFTRSLSQMLAGRNIRVNAVAPGPIWTPLIPSTFEDEKVERFGKDTSLARAGQPEEVAPCFVFLASNDASYITGQVLHPNGGVIVNG